MFNLIVHRDFIDENDRNFPFFLCWHRTPLVALLDSEDAGRALDLCDAYVAGDLDLGDSAERRRLVEQLFEGTDRQIAKAAHAIAVRIAAANWPFTYRPLVEQRSEDHRDRPEDTEDNRPHARASSHTFAPFNRYDGPTIASIMRAVDPEGLTLRDNLDHDLGVALTLSLREFISDEDKIAGIVDRVLEPVLDETLTRLTEIDLAASKSTITRRRNLNPRVESEADNHLFTS